MNLPGVSLEGASCSVLLRHRPIVVRRQVVLVFLAGRWRLGFCRRGAPPSLRPTLRSEQTRCNEGINDKCSTTRPSATVLYLPFSRLKCFTTQYDVHAVLRSGAFDFCLVCFIVYFSSGIIFDGPKVELGRVIYRDNVSKACRVYLSLCTPAATGFILHRALFGHISPHLLLFFPPHVYKCFLRCVDTAHSQR